MHDNKPADVPYIVYESDMARAERSTRRMFIALVLAIIMLFATNVGWLIYESQFETTYYEQDGEGVNNINSGSQGDVVYEPESKSP